MYNILVDFYHRKKTVEIESEVCLANKRTQGKAIREA